jgi:UDP-galactose transporter B1
MTLASLGICAGSIYVFFLLWALLQERLTTTPYTPHHDPSSWSPLSGKAQQAEYFRSPLLLNWLQATFSTLVAAVYLMLNRSKSDQRPLLDRLGLGALSSRGAERLAKPTPAVTRSQTKQQNGHALPVPVSGKVSSLVSPLLLRYLLIATLQSTSSQLGLHSLAHGISYPTLTLAKSCKLVPVLIMNVLLYRRKFPAYKYGVVALVTIGISIFMLFNAESEKKRSSKGPGKGDSLVGVGLLALNLLLDGATNSTQDEVFHRYTVSGPQMMLVMNALSSLLMGASLLLPLHSIPLLGAALGSKGGSSELQTALAFIGRHPEVVRDLLGYAMAGAIGQVAIFETLQRFGSLTLVSITVSSQPTPTLTSSILV